MKCILIRHSITKGNEEHRYLGSTDEGLSDSGCNLAYNKRQYYQELVSREAGNSEVVIFSGRMTRCMESARIIFQGKNITECGLTEIDFGDFENKTYLELKDNPEYIKYIDTGGASGAPGGETVNAFITRTFDEFIKIAEVLSDDDTNVCVIMCHGGNIMAIMSAITGLNYYDFHVGNLEGYITEFNYNNGKISDFTYNRI